MITLVMVLFLFLFILLMIPTNTSLTSQLLHDYCNPLLSISKIDNQKREFQLMSCLEDLHTNLTFPSYLNLYLKRDNLEDNHQHENILSQSQINISLITFYSPNLVSFAANYLYYNALQLQTSIHVASFTTQEDYFPEDRRWNKIFCLYQHMISKSSKEVQYFLFMDIDILIVQPTLLISRMQSLIQDHPTIDLFLSEDSLDYANTGMVLVKNSFFSQQFLSEWWSLRSQPHIFCDQHALNFLSLKYRSQLSQHIKRIPWHWMNSYWPPLVHHQPLLNSVLHVLGERQATRDAIGNYFIENLPNSLTNHNLLELRLVKELAMKQEYLEHSDYLTNAYLIYYKSDEVERWKSLVSIQENLNNLLSIIQHVCLPAFQTNELCSELQNNLISIVSFGYIQTYSDLFQINWKIFFSHQEIIQQKYLSNYLQNYSDSNLLNFNFQISTQSIDFSEDPLIPTRTTIQFFLIHIEIFHEIIKVHLLSSKISSEFLQQSLFTLHQYFLSLIDFFHFIQENLPSNILSQENYQQQLIRLEISYQDLLLIEWFQQQTYEKYLTIISIVYPSMANYCQQYPQDEEMILKYIRWSYEIACCEWKLFQTTKQSNIEISLEWIENSLINLQVLNQSYSGELRLIRSLWVKILTLKYEILKQTNSTTQFQENLQEYDYYYLSHLQG